MSKEMLYALRCKHGYVSGSVENIQLVSKKSDALYWKKEAAETIAKAFSEKVGFPFKLIKE